MPPTPTPAKPARIYAAGGYIFDANLLRVTYQPKGDAFAKLTPTQSRILELLFERRPRSVTAPAIMDVLGVEDSGPGSLNYVNVMLCHTRKRLGVLGGPPLILSTYGAGWSVCGALQSVRAFAPQHAAAVDRLLAELRAKDAAA